MKCPNTSENYGGNYKLKIGLITADELNYAGLISYSSAHNSFLPYIQSDKSNYLYSMNNRYTMTPYYYSRNSRTDSYLYYATQGYYKGETALRVTLIHPVINLKSDIKITSGDGSKSNPYVVE